MSNFAIIGWDIDSAYDFGCRKEKEKESTQVLTKWTSDKNSGQKNYVLKINMTLWTLTVADDLVLQKTIVNIDVIYIIFMLCTLILQLYWFFYKRVILFNIIAIIGLLLICNDYWY